MTEQTTFWSKEQFCCRLLKRKTFIRSCKTSEQWTAILLLCFLHFLLKDLGVRLEKQYPQIGCPFGRRAGGQPARISQKFQYLNWKFGYKILVDILVDNLSCPVRLSSTYVPGLKTCLNIFQNTDVWNLKRTKKTQLLTFINLAVVKRYISYHYFLNVLPTRFSKKLIF